MLILNILLALFITSCSFSNSEKDQDISTVEGLSTTELQKTDSDGDMINDYDEIKRGSDRFISDLPELKTNFFQDFNIHIGFEDEEYFNIKISNQRDKPDFQYRVGDIFLRDHSLQKAASIGRFSGSSWGDLVQKDFSWVKYPELNSRFYLEQKQLFSRFGNQKIKNITIDFQSSILLKEKSHFSEIRDVELAFYYYSYSKEKFIKIHSQVFNKSFQKGTREELSIDITNPPEELVRENFLRKGEFIISEINDFYIPELKTKYSTLIKSVEAKSIPLYTLTPNETSMKYVSIFDKKSSFVDILTKLYATNFEIKDNTLKSIEQFRNNLRSFKDLKELSGIDKEGRWFVLTNKLKKHYLKHTFKLGESITLNYLTGDELSRNIEKKNTTIDVDVFSGNNFRNVNIGNVSKNSEVFLSVYSKKKKGRWFKQEFKNYSFSPPNCRNCTGTNWSVSADYSHNRFKDYEISMWASDSDEVLNHLSLTLNGKELNIDRLREESFVEVYLNQSTVPSSLEIKLSHFGKFAILKDSGENILTAKIKAINVKRKYSGFELINVTGQNIDILNNAGHITVGLSSMAKLPISLDSFRFKELERNIPWGKTDTNGHVWTRSTPENSFDGIVIDIASSVINYTN